MSDIQSQIDDLIFNFNKYKTTSNSKFKTLQQKFDEQQSIYHAQTSHFNTMKRCLDVYVDTMKQLRFEYQTLKYHVKLLEEQNIDPNLFSSLKENSELHTQKIHLLENKINTLEHEISANRFISEPLNSNSNFNPSAFLTPELHFDSDVVEMSPFTL